ncbi:DUF4099 domain-containing protein [Bacteroides fragilis]|uniref:DUF4099 domain-containing protein n=1 Tax=Bacteroides fragilis (strain YCH46) TaxID=295405 RepID=Q64MD3_BACFR|nr:DUF4099 domain-containing protein [Bacteroides fragilis]BAD51354.1 conserved hypothetical protein [Bacteroides fragilis YCH46]
MNMSQDKFKENEIPYKQLELIGISKKDILSLNKENLEALFAGKRTHLLPIKGVDDKGEEFAFKAKISLYHKENGQVGINIHPIRPEINNEYDLKEKELHKLRNGELVTKTLQGEKFVIQLDKETNELLKARSKDISIPNIIKDVSLSNAEKDALRQGKEVFLGKEKDLVVQLDLNNPRGIAFKEDVLKKQAIEYDRINPHIRGTIQSDRNNNEYSDYLKNKEKVSVNDDLKISKKNNIKL